MESFENWGKKTDSSKKMQAWHIFHKTSMKVNKAIKEYNLEKTDGVYNYGKALKRLEEFEPELVVKYHKDSENYKNEISRGGAEKQNNKKRRAAYKGIQNLSKEEQREVYEYLKKKFN